MNFSGLFRSGFGYLIVEVLLVIFSIETINTSAIIAFVIEHKININNILNYYSIR